MPVLLPVIQCAGSSVKEILFKWAKRENWSGAVVEACDDVGQTSVSGSTTNISVFFYSLQVRVDLWR